MNEAEKQAECQRICGDSAKRNIHFQPCPILKEIWQGKRPKQKFQNLETGEKKP